MDVIESRNDPKFEFRVQRSSSIRSGSGYTNSVREANFQVELAAWEAAKEEQFQFQFQ